MSQQMNPKEIDRLIADLEQRLTEARKTLDALIACTRPDNKPKPIRLVDPRNGKRLI